MAFIELGKLGSVLKDSKTIKAANIIGGIITAKELIIAGGTNGIIRSQNFVAGTSGWIWRGDGTMEAQSGIFRGTLNASDIVAGTLVTDRIDARTIRANHIQVSGENMMPDPGFEGKFQVLDDDDGIWKSTSEVTLDYIPDDGGADVRGGAFALRINGIHNLTGDAQISLMGDYVANVATGHGVLVNEGEKLYLSFYVGDRGSAGGAYVAARIRFHNEAGTSLSNIDGTLVSPPTVSTGAVTWAFCEVQATVPGEAVIAYPVVFIDQSAITGTGNLHIEDVVFRRQTARLMIENQAVDIVRQLDPIYTEAVNAFTQNVSISTSPTQRITTNLTIPSFVGTVDASCYGRLQVTDSGTKNFEISVFVGGTIASSNTFHGVSNNTQTMNNSGARTIAAPGSTVSVALFVANSSGTNNTNEIAVLGIALGIR